MSESHETAVVRKIDESAKALGLASAVGFTVLAVLLVMLVITEENIVGTAAGLVAIVTGICLGLFLRRTEPEPVSEVGTESESDAPADREPGSESGTVPPSDA